MQFGSLRKSLVVDASTSGTQGLAGAVEIELDRLIRNPQIRKTLDSDKLRELAESIKDHGVLQPIRIRWSEQEAAYIVIAGHRRMEASMLAGKSTIPAIIADVDEAQASYEQAIENIQREDLKPSERARGFAAILETQGISRNELAKQLGIGKATVLRSLQLLELDDVTLQRLDSGELNESAARKILAMRSEEQVSKGDAPKSKPSKKPRGAKEIKLTVEGYTVTVKARRVLDDARVLEALTSALASVSTPRISVQEAA